MNYNKADFIASYGISSQLPESDRPELSFSGRSNVGKSSLINKLCNRKNLARVSATPGKTATINFYEVDSCYFVDLPGYGYAKVSNADRERWDDLINSYFEADRHHTLLVQLLDCRHAPSADERYAEARAHSLLAAKKSRRAAAQNLRRKGLSAQQVAAALDAVYTPDAEGEDPELEAAAALVESRYRGKLAAGRRDLVVAALQRRGFAYAVVKKAIQRVEEE